MGYGGGGGGGGGSGGSGGSGGGYGGGSGGGSGYRRVGEDRTANLKVNNITNRTGGNGTDVDGVIEAKGTHFIPPSGTTAERGSRGRGIFSGGLSGVSPTVDADTIDYVTIATLGNATDFGNLSTARSWVLVLLLFLPEDSFCRSGWTCHTNTIEYFYNISNR